MKTLRKILMTLLPVRLYASPTVRLMDIIEKEHSDLGPIHRYKWWRGRIKKAVPTDHVRAENRAEQIEALKRRLNDVLVRCEANALECRDLRHRLNVAEALLEWKQLEATDLRMQMGWRADKVEILRKQIAALTAA